MYSTVAPNHSVLAGNVRTCSLVGIDLETHQDGIAVRLS